MAERRYNYYGVHEGKTWHMVSNSGPTMMRWWMPELMSKSTKVWCQGPQGGIRVVRHNWDFGNRLQKIGYVTQDEKAMKEFAWVKLTAQTIENKHHF